MKCPWCQEAAPEHNWAFVHLAEYDAVQEGVELGYLCSRDGTPCEFEDYPYKYGEDADGNRGEWRVERRCRKCGEYPHDD